MSRRRTPDRRTRRVVFLLLGAAFAIGPIVSAGAAEPATRSLEAGGAASHYTGGLGDADAQFVRFGMARADDYSWRLEIGREHRFGERSFNYGGGVTRTLGGTTFGLGLGSGTNRYLAPRYRFDASVMRPLGGVLTTLGYTRLQSKAVNRSDGIGLGLVRYVGHWILGASGRVEFGSPGRTTSTSGGGSVTWFIWKQTYLGVGYEAGRVSYLLLGPGLGAQVDYPSKDFNATFSQWFNAKSGVNLRFDYGETPFYTVRGGTLSFFAEW